QATLESRSGGGIVRGLTDEVTRRGLLGSGGQSFRFSGQRGLPPRRFMARVGLTREPPMENAAEPLQRTPLYELHLSLGAKLVPFAGYEMPVQYPAGILAEHLHTRAAAGLFDVSHMGQVRLKGADAAKALETLCPGDIQALGPMRQRYTLFTNDAGGILDDLMVTNAGDHLFVVVNAACKIADV